MKLLFISLLLASTASFAVPVNPSSNLTKLLLKTSSSLTSFQLPETRHRLGSRRVGGRNSHSKGSHYKGGR